MTDTIHGIMPSVITETTTPAQGRILIWRSEVASARDPLEPEHPSTHEASSSLSNSSSSPTTTTNNTASSTSPPLSRSRRFLRRISRRLSGRARHPEDGTDPNGYGFRTAMYRSLVQPSHDDLAGAALHDPRVDPGGPSSGSDAGARGGLREKQERLMRAARLLDQGVKPRNADPAVS